MERPSGEDTDLMYTYVKNVAIQSCFSEKELLGFSLIWKPMTQSKSKILAQILSDCFNL